MSFDGLCSLVVCYSGGVGVDHAMDFVPKLRHSGMVGAFMLFDVVCCWDCG